MPTSGPYEFRLAAKAVGGLIEDALDLGRGEWAWIDRSGDVGQPGWLMIYACCPDCGEPLTLYRRRGESEPAGHSIDAQGNVHPSVLHSYIVGGVEQCGFHTMPTRLLGFVDRRGPGGC